MKIKDLIKVLSKEDQEKEVFVSYDTFAASYHLENIIEVFNSEANRDQFYVPGIHLLAMADDWIDYFLTDKNCEHPIEGRCVHRKENS